MAGSIGVTDTDWFAFLAQQPGIDEVNFWQPGGTGRFRALEPGEPFLFKLHAPYNYIVGGGFFAHFMSCKSDWRSDQTNGLKRIRNGASCVQYFFRKGFRSPSA